MSKIRFLPIVVLILLGLVIPVSLFLITQNQDIRQRAQTAQVLAKVQVQPPQITAYIDGPQIGLSALAYDTLNQPINTGIVYEWGISSTYSIGTLTQTYGNITAFQPQNLGNGSIYVIARQGNLTATISLPVEVNNIPPAATEFFLEQQPTTDVTMGISQPNTGYAVMAILKDKEGKVVVNQQDFTYNWSIDDGSLASVSPFSGCTNGIQPPCPLDHATIVAYSPGQTTIRVRVEQNSTAQVVARATFSLTVTPPPSGTPEDICIQNGGTWIFFSNGCMDSCSYAQDPGQMCLAVMLPGCDCGFDKCWDGSTCVANPTPSCEPRPACLDEIPPCEVPIPISGWCPETTPTPSPTPEPTPSPSPSIFPSPSSTPQSTPNIPMIYTKFTLQGVDTVLNPNKTTLVDIEFKLGNDVVLTKYNQKAIQLADPVYFQTQTPISDALLEAGTTYNVTVKEPTHLSRKTTITLALGTNVVDFSQSVQSVFLAGDIYTDNTIDVSDFNRVIENFGSRMPASGSPADLNYDDAVNVYDYSYVVSNFGSSGE